MLFILAPEEQKHGGPMTATSEQLLITTKTWKEETSEILLAERRKHQLSSTKLKNNPITLEMSGKRYMGGGGTYSLITMARVRRPCMDHNCRH